jgi:tagaturonate reductase
LILQFGTSRFLQAHVDLFASEAREDGQDVPDIVIVQTSDDPGRAKRLVAFADPDGFPVRLRGLLEGEEVDREVRVRSVRQGLSARRDWAALSALFVHEADYVVSNSGDTGFVVPPEDRAVPAGSVSRSFCGMLLDLLHARWGAGRDGLTFLPCELVARNGTTLRDILTTLAQDRALKPDFVEWMRQSCIWADTLVDRIVSEPLEPAGAVAEPYALWAIARQPGLRLPFTHPSVVLTDDLERFERLKIHVLNLGHSWLAERWRAGGSKAGMTVREALADAVTVSALTRLYDEEVIPGFAARGLEREARDYAAVTIERFRNPFLDHRLSDIAQHHAEKLEKRVVSFLKWVDATGVDVPMPMLRTWVAPKAAVAA